jgi:hypothetical protein
MTEADYLCCTDLARLLDFLRESGLASQRRLRLFLAGYWRWQGAGLRDAERDRLLRAVSLAEQWADTGQCPPQADRRFVVLRHRPWPAARQVAQSCPEGGSEAFRAWVASARQQKEALLRCLFANPFRPLPPRAFPAHVIGLARACYEAFPAVSDDYKVLADALADLGEDVAAAHCREATHAKGCHSLDWVLGRP